MNLIATFCQRCVFIPAFVAALLWGSAFPAIKYGYRLMAETLTDLVISDYMIFAGFRFAIAGLVLLLGSVIYYRKRISQIKTDKAFWGMFILFSLSQTVLQYSFFYGGLFISSSILGAVFTFSNPLLWMLLSIIFLRAAKPTVKQGCYFVLCCFGIGLGVFDKSNLVGNNLQGSLFFLLSNLAGALGSIFLISLVKKAPVAFLSGLSLLAGGIVLAVMGCASWQRFYDCCQPVFITLLVYLSFVSAGAFMLWNYLITIHSVRQLASYKLLTPLCALLLSALLVPQENLSQKVVIGSTIALISMYGIYRENKRIT